jgi:HEPN domain-containing protein
MTEAKVHLVRSWIIKAQHDLASARVLAASDPPLLDTAIYHCQQAAEKAVKGYLVFCDHAFERIHDVEVLIRTASPKAMTSRLRVPSDAGNRACRMRCRGSVRCPLRR